MRVAQRRDLRRDLGEAALGVGALAHGLVQARVRHRDCGLAGEHLEQLLVGLPEGIAGLRVNGDRADCALLADERSAHHGSDAVLADVAIRRLRVTEALVREVVAAANDAPLDDRASGDALVEHDRIGLLVALDRQVDGGVPEGPVQAAGLGHELDASPVGVEQPHGFVERALEDVVRVADGGDARGDLADAALGLHAVLELLGRRAPPRRSAARW